LIVSDLFQGDWEGEGNDRQSMALPPGVDTMISRVASVNPRTIVVNISGSPVSMPWASEIASIAQAWYGGNEAGNGIADVLFGDFNPSGKLPISWPHDESYTPSFLNFGSVQGRCIYGEDVYVGYKYYDKVGRGLQWHFGHGLSYTTFKISSLKVSTSADNEHVKTFPDTHVTVDVTNTGEVAGAEVLQLYVTAPMSSTARPIKELHGFTKVHLRAGEKKRVLIDVDPYAMSYWDEVEQDWCIEKGTYEIIVATTSKEDTADTGIQLRDRLTITKTRRWFGL
jgi:beta-glucosidase